MNEIMLKLNVYSKGTHIVYDDAFFFATGIVILNLLNTFVNNHVYHVSFHNGMKVRVAALSTERFASSNFILFTY